MKAWRDLERAAREQGWKIAQTSRRHLKWLAPDGDNIVVSAGTPSDWRAFNNHLARMRRAGFRG